MKPREWAEAEAPLKNLMQTWCPVKLKYHMKFAVDVSTPTIGKEDSVLYWPFVATPPLSDHWDFTILGHIRVLPGLL